MVETTLDLPIERLYLHPDNIRQDVGQEQIEEMALSVLLFGLIYPLIVVVRPERDGWYTVEGNVRLMAARLLIKEGRWPEGWPPTLPAFVRDLTLEQQRAIMLATQTRYSLNPVDEGMAYKRKVEQEKLSPEQIAARYGVALHRVQNALRIVSLAPPVMEMFRRGELPRGAADHLVKVIDPRRQTDLARTLVDMDAIHVNTVKEAVKRLTGEPEKKKNGKEPLPPPTPVLMPRTMAERIRAASSIPPRPGNPAAYGLAELRLAAQGTCQTCTARALPQRLLWSKTEQTWLGHCNSCEIVRQVSDACLTCPLAHFIEKLYQAARVEENDS